MDSEFKICSSCRNEKSFDLFYKDKRKKDGLYASCKDCVNLRARNKENKLIELGIKSPKKYEKLSDDIKIEIERLYNLGLGCMKISKIVNYSKPTIVKHIKKSGLTRKNFIYRKYKFINEGFFDNINTEEKAYFLGLLWADGCNYINDITKAYQTIISLQEQDGYILSRLANYLYENDNILRLIDKTTNYDDYNRQNQITLRIPSKHISSMLKYYGMIPRKSSILKMPININWTEDLLRWFIKGFFDGDGSIYHNSHSDHYGCSFISSIEHIQELNILIEKFIGKPMSYELKSNYITPMATLKFHGNQITKKFLDWLYLDSTIHLNRKYQKYLTLKDIVESK